MVLLDKVEMIKIFCPSFFKCILNKQMALPSLDCLFLYSSGPLTHKILTIAITLPSELKQHFRGTQVEILVI